MCIRDRCYLFKRTAAVKTYMKPSLIRSIGYDGLRQQTMNHETFTIIRNHYLKDIRGDLMEEEITKNNNNNSEIAYISAEVNGITTKIMIDTGANVSLIDQMELNKIQNGSKETIPTLPINNIT